MLSLEAPSPVGSVQSLRFLSRPSRSHALVVCPLPPPAAAEAKEEKPTGLGLEGRPASAPYAERMGRGGAVRVSLV